MIDLKLLKGSPKIDATAILALPELRLTETGASLNKSGNGWITRRRKQEAFLVKRGSASLFYSGDGSRLILVSLPERDSRKNELREAAYSAVKTARQHGLKRIALLFDPEDEFELQAVGEGALLSAYSFKRFKTKPDPKPELQTVYVQGDQSDAIRRASIFASATLLVRDLVNEPPNVLNPARLEELAVEAAREKNLKLRVFRTAQLQKMGANSFLSVGMGSIVPSRMIQLTYTPETKAKAHVVLVGKGVTFDSGGLSLKTEKGMEHMKSDMAGAATVLACVRAARDLNLPVKVTSLLMAVENMPDGGANRPGDVVRAMNGKTIEITNTDAEGRLALADGLVYAHSLRPDYLIDIATLTGAQVVGLGRLVAGMMGNNESLQHQLSEAGKESGELMWPMPLPDHYREMIKSDIADVKNSSGITDAGSIQGGLFLSEFVTHPRWAHLDIAGPSWQEREWSVHPRNASGFAARCLLTFLSRL